MKKCLHCEKEFQEKKDTAKYCSVSCRVMYNRNHPKERVTKTQMQVLYTEMLALIEKGEKLYEAGGFVPERVFPVSPEMMAALYNQEHPGQHTSIKRYDYNGVKGLISAATSSFELEHAWKIVKAMDLAAWQMRELTKLRENQQTKIEF